MRSARESYWLEGRTESDGEVSDGGLADSAASSGNDEFRPEHLIYSIIELHRANVEIMLRFSLTSRTNHDWVFGWLAENLSVLDQPGGGWLLLSLENLLAAQDERAAYVAKCIGSQLAGAGMILPISEAVLSRVVAATIHSGSISPLFQANIVRNAAALFGNRQSLRWLLKHGFELPEVIDKVKEKVGYALERGDQARAERFLAVLRELTEFEMKHVLESIIHKIKTYDFVLHNNGGVLVDDIDRKVPAHAASVFSSVMAALKSTSDLMMIYEDLAVKLKEALRGPDSKAKSSSSWSLMSWLSLPTSGVRDSSTTACYQQIIEMLDNGMVALMSYQRFELSVASKVSNSAVLQ